MRAFSAHQTCLVQRNDANWGWNGTQLTGINEIVIGRPLGYAALPSPAGQKFQMHYTLSGTMDLNLLQKGRIHAVTTLCNIDGQPLQSKFIESRQLRIMQPPLHSNTGYLIFSRQFYQNHQQAAELLWQQLALDKGSDIYRHYITSQFDQSATTPTP